MGCVSGGGGGAVACAPLALWHSAGGEVLPETMTEPGGWCRASSWGRRLTVRWGDGEVVEAFDDSLPDD
jgi:hypothetical protein